MHSQIVRRHFHLSSSVCCAALAIVALAPVVASATVLGDVSIADRYAYTKIYQFSPVGSQNWSTTSYYTTDNSGTPLPDGFSRIGYYMELQAGAGPRNWVWVSMDAYTTQLGKIGVPTVADGEFYNFSNTSITNMTVRSNVGSITTGAGITTGNIEFWPSNYAQGNDYGVPGASTTNFDFGDGSASLVTGHGTMQFHNYGAGQVLFAYNAFNGGAGGIGIGNDPAVFNGATDWTFTSNGFSLHNIEIWVLDNSLLVPEPSSLMLLGLGVVGLAVKTRRRRQRSASSC